MHNLTISISPCPNDTFMFDALLHGKIDTKGYRFEYNMLDIDQLNSAVKEGRAGDFSKISYAVYPSIASDYKVLRAGSALGFGNAPLVVSKHKIYPDELSSCSIAIPGVDTTANMLLHSAFGEIKELRSYLFSDIAEVVLEGDADAGVLIHEERFTYGRKGLALVADLGEIWDNKYSLPVPLGAIVASNTLDRSVVQDFNSLLVESIQFAFDNPRSSYSFVRENAQMLDDEVIENHINMFVNNFSLDIGLTGVDAVLTLLSESGGNFNETIFI